MVTAIKGSRFAGRATAALLTGTMLSSFPMAALAQAPAAKPAASPAPAQPAVVAPPPAPVQRTIKSLRVEGSQRIEPETVLSYTSLRVGQPYTNETLDQAIKDLIASDLFADVAIAGAETGDIVIRIRENPIINRVVLEGNKTLKSDKITKEIKLKARDIFTRSAVRQDVGRIIELYRRQGRFAATVDPKMVALDQNRVDVIFEISEGPKSKVRQINIIGNQVFSDDKLREQMATKQARFFRVLSSATSYDQDRLAYDQQKLRLFYLTNGYADFRVTSAVAELTPDKRDFIITYVVEEGKRYKFGDVTVDSDIRDFDDKKLAASLPFKKGDWFNAKQVEDAVDSLSKTAGLFGYAFADVNPEYQRDPETLTMGINFHIAEAQRTYVERIDINGNVNTHDKVIRREMRLAEGDAFNSFQLTRSQDRINSLGYFQDKLEIQQKQGSSPDRVLLQTDVQEKPTGSLNLSAGYSSLEKFIIQASITQANFRGLGQTLSASVDYSAYSKSVDLSFTEPFLFDKNVALGADIYRRDLNAFNYTGSNRNTIYSQTSTGFQVRTSVPLTEYLAGSLRYTLQYDDVGLPNRLFTDGTCDPLLAGRYLCDSLGKRLSSIVGYSLIYSTLDNSLRPTKGETLTFSQDFAGLGGDVAYVRTRGEGHKYWNVGKGFILSVSGEGGWILPLQSDNQPGVDAIRLNDRFYLGEPQFRGFDIRGVGPRIERINFTDGSPSQTLLNGKNQIVDDALGGRAYYLGHLEMEIPLPSGARELGLRPSIFMDVGALFGLKQPLPTATFPTLIDPATGKSYVGSIFRPATDPSTGAPLYLFTPVNPDGTAGIPISTLCATGEPTATGCAGSTANPRQINETTPFIENYYGDSPRPRLSIGFGVNWKSPFGPLRIDIAKALLHQKGEDTKLVTFNVGTQF